MKCRYCGSNNPSSGITCLKCGRKISENPPSSNFERSKKSEEKTQKQIPPVRKTAPLKNYSENSQQNNGGSNSPLSTLTSPIKESSDKRKTSTWELYPRTGSYFVLDSSRDMESGSKEEEEDSSDLLSGRYRIIRRLGSGGMSVVYLARDTKMETDVVIKEMSASSNMKDNGEYLRKRFDEEAKLLYRLHWSGIPKVTEFFSDNDSNYLVMEYVHGENLEKVLEAREIPVITIYEFVDWMGQLLETLIYLHSCDPPVIHRDIKPSNIMLNDEGDVILVDFGLAKSLSYFTSPQTKVGTRGYASPEHYLGKTSKASDIYSLGASFHYLLTHEKPETRLPFEFPPISAYREDLGDDVDYIMEKMLEKSEKNRYASAAEVLEDLNLLSDFLAESYQGQEFPSEEVDIKQARQNAKTGLFKKTLNPSASASQKKQEENSPAPSRIAPETIKTPEKPIHREVELPGKDAPAKRYRTRAMKTVKQKKAENNKAVAGSKPTPEPASTKPGETTKARDNQKNGNTANQSAPEKIIERPKKSDLSKAPRYSHNGLDTEVEIPHLSQPGNNEITNSQTSVSTTYNKSQSDDEFAEESFIEKSFGYIKLLIIIILIFTLGAIAYLFGPSLLKKYVPEGMKPANQKEPIAAESSGAPLPSPTGSSIPTVEDEHNNLMQARRYLAEGKNDKAILVFTVILAKEPDNADALTGRGSAYFAIKDMKSAFDDLSRAISIDPNKSEAYLKRSEIHLSRNSHREAEKDLNWALSLSPDDPYALYLRGTCCEKKGELDKAITDLSRIPDNLEKDTKSQLYKDTIEALGRIYRDRGISFMMPGKYESAIEDFKESLKYKPESPEIYKLMAEAYLNLNNTEESIKMYNKVLEKKPDSEEIKEQLVKLNYMLGTSRLKENKPALALQNFETALKYDPENSEIKKSLIETYGKNALQFVKSKKYAEAINFYNKILELAPEDGETYFQRGLAYYNSGNKKLARIDFDKYTALMPGGNLSAKIPKDMLSGKPLSPAARAAATKALVEKHIANAEEALKKEDYIQTEQNADLALKIDSHSGHAFFLKGVANLKLEKPEVAENCFLEVVKYDKEDTLARIQSGKFLARMYDNRAKEEIDRKSFETADEYARKAIKFDERCASAYISRGIAHIETNRKKEAIEFLEKAKQKSEGIDTPLYNMASELIEKAKR